MTHRLMSSHLIGSAVTSAVMGSATVIIPEMELLIGQLERGTVVTKFSHRKRPEKKTLMVRRETRQIVCQKSSRGQIESSVDLREIRDIRVGKTSKDFEKWPDDAKKHEASKCFVIYYGSEFRLTSLSVAAFSEKECDLWFRTIKYLWHETLEASYNLQLETWLRKQFYSLDNNYSTLKATINLKELKAFLPKINCKLSTGRLRDIFNEYDSKQTGEIGFDDFSVLFRGLVHDQQIMYNLLSKYSQNGLVTYDSLTDFFIQEQQEIIPQVHDVMNRFFQDPNRVESSHITSLEFLDYLFSKQNSIWDDAQNSICQDMSRPLSHYFISSSHNTYLTGDQFSSESSTEAYIRCLLQSCRCVELDCWDGSDGQPFIYHGHTLTSKIKFSDVCRVIRDYAFATSEYPLILSIEDHCTLPQQRKMAQIFMETFGDILVTSQINKNETVLPSPDQLKGRILLKHKKLPEGTIEEEQFTRVEDFSKDMDLSNTIKNGIMYIEDNMQWQPHFFVLTTQKLLFTEMTMEPPESDQNQATTSEDETTQEPPKTEELHYSEKWFHGRLKGGRSAAVALISNYKREDGTFLVRESETFVGDYTLSAWRKGRVIHCHIHSKYEWGQVKYYLVDSLLFDSLYSLISYYREHPIRGLEFHVKLGDPVPQPSMHEGKPWFHKIDRISAEDYLRRVRLDGTFVVRPSSTASADDQKFVISFRAKNKIKHCVIKEDGRLFIVGENKFETLADLVQHYHKYPFYQGVCLKWPLTEELMRAEVNSDPTDIYSEYLDTNAMKTEEDDSNLVARALYDYSARQDDEISFRKDDIITHVIQEFEGWWRGECNGAVGLFPCNRVVIIEDNSILGDLQKGCIELTGAKVDLQRVSVSSTNDFPWRVVIEKNGSSHSFGVEQEEEGIIWVDAIRGVGEIASERESEHKKMERINRVAKELSSLIIYCCSVNKFSMERIKLKKRCFQEMSSFPETTAEKLFTSDKESFLWYHELQLSRVYPKGQRLDSSNYMPVPFWGVGCQMVALNYQTPDKALQLNQAKFRQNGRCGYILRPEYQFPSETLAEPVLQKFELTVIGGRHLWKSGRGIVSPFAEIEVMGSDHRTLHFNHVHKTRTIPDNGLNPYWNETFPFSVYFPESTMIRVSVYDEDMFGDRNFIGQASYPLHCLKPGFRSMQLLNGFSDEIELATLLVHFFKA